MDLRTGVCMCVLLLGLLSFQCGARAAMDTLTCHRCSPYYNGYSFPGCLQIDQACQAGQSCLFIYNDKGDSLESSFTSSCSSPCRYLEQAPSTADSCQYGGIRMATGQCIVCCRTNACVQQTVPRFLLKSVPGHAPPAVTGRTMCPRPCLLSNPDACRSNPFYCEESAMCVVTVDVAEKKLVGACVDLYHQSACQTFNRDHHCPFTPYDAQKFLSGYQGATGSCYLGCCQSNACVSDIFLANALTSTIPSPPTTITTSTEKPTTTTTTTPTTRTKKTVPTSVPPTSAPSSSLPQPSTAPTLSPPTTTTTSSSPPATTTSFVDAAGWFNFTSLMTECRNHLPGGTCNFLRTSNAICRTSHALTMCPDTCGVCKEVRATACVDKASLDDCRKFVRLTSGGCSDPLAVFMCAKSCDLCNEVVRAIVEDALKASPASPDFGSQPTSKSPPAFHCDDLTKVDCVEVKDVCAKTNLDEVCPQQCNACP